MLHHLWEEVQEEKKNTPSSQECFEKLQSLKYDLE